MITHPSPKKPLLVCIYTDYGPGADGDQYHEEFIYENDEVTVATVDIDYNELYSDRLYCTNKLKVLKVFDPKNKSNAYVSIIEALKFHDEGLCYCCDFG